MPASGRLDWAGPALSALALSVFLAHICVSTSLGELARALLIMVLAPSSRGYRDGPYYRAQHAGLLGADTLIVNDESHLEPAFARLLLEIEKLGPGNAVSKPFRVLLVSATDRGIGKRPFAHDIQEDAKASARFRRVYEAEKRLYLHEAPDIAAARIELERLALGSDAKRVIVFVEEPENAAKLASKIARTAGPDRVVLLTGTMRGHERDQLGQGSFQKFEQPASPETSFFLVTTSAAEVGVNISGECLVTTLVESDRLLQRLGRLNRFGDQDGEAHRVGEAHVVFVRKKQSDHQEPLTAEHETLAYLRGLPKLEDGSHDVSCRAVREHPAPGASRSAEPRIARFDERLIDLWSLTTASSKAMPKVEHWLHGKQDDDYPQTELAWRAEVPWLAEEGVSKKDREAALERYRVLPQETLKEPTNRLKKKLASMPAGHRATRTLFEDSNGNIEAYTLDELIRCEDDDLRGGLILLPPCCGRLAGGMLQESESEGTPANDIADHYNEESGARARYLVEQVEEKWQVRHIGSEEPQQGGLNTWADGLPPGGRLLRVMLPSQDEGARRFLIFQTEASSRKRVTIGLETHLADVAATAKKIAGSAGLGELQESFEGAGICHDEGKRCELWQNAMGGDVLKPLAKTAKPANPNLLGGYRHELASLLKALDKAPNDDLLLHLVASHHGWARPFWNAKAYHPKQLLESGRAAMDAARRFNRLQRKWGPWGLAYLESLFKAADGIASDQEERIERD